MSVTATSATVTTDMPYVTVYDEPLEGGSFSIEYCKKDDPERFLAVNEYEIVDKRVMFKIVDLSPDTKYLLYFRFEHTETGYHRELADTFKTKKL